MKKVCICIISVSLILLLVGCGQSSGRNLFEIGIQVAPNPVSVEKEFQMSATLNESIINQSSWFLFELRSPETKGSIWVPGNYEGKGVYSAVTNLSQQGAYQLSGHYYAGGGIHFTEKYKLEVFNNPDFEA